MSNLEWDFIKAVLPNKTRGKWGVDDRRVINGIFIVLRTGIPWADLPEQYGTDQLQPMEFCGSLGPDHGRHRRCLGRSRGGLGTKIHALTNQDGLPIRSELIPGQAHDSPPCKTLLDNDFVAQIGSPMDSPHESSVIAGGHEQLDTYEVQDPELGRVYPFAEAMGIARDLV